jgi:hypothetical protein
MSARSFIRSSSLRAFIICLIATGLFAPTYAADSGNIPQRHKASCGLRKNGEVTQLFVDGKPFIILGGQVGNASAFPERMERAWPKLKELNANTVEFPVYWEQIEPEEGRFEFDALDQIIRGARENGLRAILLWFATWKNGTMDYVPAWVKSNPERFSRVINKAGEPIRVLSPHSQANLQADRKAYSELMKHLREIDGSEHTVILMQVQNEPGLRYSPRDYSPQATQLFNGPVPEQLVPVAELKALKKQPGTWKEVFGNRRAEEAFTAYYLSTFINEVARAGKEIYPLPTFVNVWMGGEGTNDRFTEFDRPGDSYPSGGAVSHMLDLWKASAPDIDMIGPDIYHQSPTIYREILSRYSRPDNPLLVVETRGSMKYARYFFYALADYSAVGFTPFSIDYGPENGLSSAFVPMAENFRVIKPVLSKIAELQAAGKLQAAVEEEFIPGRMLYFDGYDILARFRPPFRSSGQPLAPTGLAEPSGRVLVGQLGPDEFLFVGFDAALDFKPSLGSQYTGVQFLLVEEGVYENDIWKRMEQRSGDFTDRGLTFLSKGAVIRAELMRY